MKKCLIIVVLFLIVHNVYALYYGIPISIEGDNINGVQICSGETPFPTNAIFPVSAELRHIDAKYLKIVNGKIVARTTDERAFVDLSMQYKKKVNGIWVEMTTEEKRLINLPAKYKHQDGTEMTVAEKATVDAAEEIIRQSAKPLVLKKAENTFLALCDQLTGVTTHAKLGFDLIKEILENLPAEMQIGASLQLLAIDAELKREGGNLWWDDCAWHPEI
jgi:hypothetical protein